MALINLTFNNLRHVIIVTNYCHFLKSVVKNVMKTIKALYYILKMASALKPLKMIDLLKCLIILFVKFPMSALLKKSYTVQRVNSLKIFNLFLNDFQQDENDHF